jgi:hypothetical protein
MQGGPKYQYKYTQTRNGTQTQSLIEIMTQRFGNWFCFRHHPTMDKVQKYNSFNLCLCFTLGNMQVAYLTYVCKRLKTTKHHGMVVSTPALAAVLTEVCGFPQSLPFTFFIIHHVVVQLVAMVPMIIQ